MSAVRKGYCYGCPFNVGEPATEMAYNLGCLPGIGDIRRAVGDTHAWACHSEPEKVCCGDAANRSKPLYYMEGVHSLEARHD